VFSAVQFTVPVFLVSSFHGPFELRRQKMAEMLSLDHHRCSMNGPADHSQNRAFCYTVPALYKFFHLLLKC